MGVTQVRVLMVLVLGLLLGLRRLVRVPAVADPEGPDVVVADDGARLHVELDGDPAADVTVVFVHGFTARLEEFFLQREALRSRARLVLYDQRGHGRSGWGDVRRATIDQLGRDLAAVLDRHARQGPVVLVGHSLGGMTVMALARQRPDLIGSRVHGALLLATAAGNLVDSGLLGRLARLGKRLHLLPLWLRLLRLWAPVIERLRRPGTPAGYLVTRRSLFGRDDADPAQVRMVQDLLELAPFTISAAFYPTFLEHDETASLAVLRDIPTVVLCGDSDRMTPVRHSRSMAADLGPATELVVVPGAGHSVNITRQQVVDDAVLRLMDRARASATGRATA